MLYKLANIAIALLIKSYLPNLATGLLNVR